MYTIKIIPHSYPTGEIKAIKRHGLFNSIEEAHKELENLVKKDLECYKNENLFGGEGFKADFDSDYDAIIRFWDGDDYKIVVEYEIYNEANIKEGEQHGQ